mgnify:CR=1 FL=1
MVDVTAAVETLNVVEVVPLANAADAGVFANPELSDSLTIMSEAPVIAGSEIVAVPVEGRPPFTEAGAIDNPVRTGLTLTVIVAVRLTPSNDAVTVPVSSVVTLPPVTVNALLVSPVLKISEVGA